MKNKKIDGYIYTLPVKTSDYISEGKFYIQSPLSKESAVDMINEVLEELKVDTANFVKLKIKRDQKYIVIYLIFIVIVCSLWLVNNQKLILHNWASSSIGLLLFLIPLVVMRLINHTIFDTLLFRKKAERKFQKEFFSKAVQ